MQHQLDQLRLDLRSEKITKRKVRVVSVSVDGDARLPCHALNIMQDGVKLLKSLLDNAAFRSFMDAETARQRPYDKVAGWWGVADGTLDRGQVPVRPNPVKGCFVHILQLS